MKQVPVPVFDVPVFECPLFERIEAKGRCESICLFCVIWGLMCNFCLISFFISKKKSIFATEMASSETAVSIVKMQSFKGLYNEILRQRTGNSLPEGDSGHG